MSFRKVPFLVAITCVALVVAPAPVSAQDGSRFSTELALDVRSPQIADVTDDGRRAAIDRDLFEQGDSAPPAGSMVV